MYLEQVAIAHHDRAAIGRTSMYQKKTGCGGGSAGSVVPLGSPSLLKVAIAVEKVNNMTRVGLERLLEVEV